MSNSNTYKIAAAAVLLVCFVFVAIIIGSVGDEENVKVAKKEATVEKKRSVAEETMAEIEQSKRDAAYRIEMRKRNHELDEANVVSDEPAYKKFAPASSAPLGLTEAQKKDYEHRSSYINSKRRQLEATLKKTARRQAANGFPVEDDYIQNELDKFDAKYGRWN